MSDLWITAFTSAGAVGLITAVFQAIVGRRKLSADATKVIEESATSAVKRVEEDNARLRARVEKIEALLDELRKDLRSRDRQVDDLSEEVEAQAEEIAEWHIYTEQLRAELQRRDPALRLPEPPARLARHFPP